MENLSHRVIKGYKLQERIGAGGFGAVYKALQSTIGREVAIKFILPGFSNHPDFIRRFETEAHVIARLEHPHIVPLYDYWRDPEGAYLVMRWLRGGSLREKLTTDGALDAERVVVVLDQITSGLYLAHRHDIVHRDIKPANILLDEDGNAYLADFGIAKDLTNLEGGQTGVDDIVGSLDYLSPEQARSDAVTSRTDIYSLGVMLYEMLVGEHPFKDVSPVERLYKHINDPLPDLTVLDLTIRDAVNDVIQKATQKNPEHRYSDVLTFAADFRRAVQATDSLASQLTQREYDVLVRIVEGLSNKQIAEDLFITVGTVKSYINQLYKKLGVRSRVQATIRAHELNLLEAGVGQAIPELGSDSYLPEPENPYKGLRAFEAADHRDFFGREKLVEKLLDKMGEDKATARFIAVLGPSGSGKSSLVKAGLIPAIWNGRLPGSDLWYTVEMLPGSHPMDELEVALTRIAAREISTLNEHLWRDNRGLLRASQLILPEDKSEIVLVIDQFEEVFTHVEDEEERRHFLDILYATVTDTRSRIRVVVTMRADFYDRPLHYLDFGDLLRNRMETILPLSAKGLERAIAGPAERVKVTFEEGLVAYIVSEMNYQAGALPLLQYALTELFEQRQGRVLTHEAYQQIGGAVGALAKRADALFAEMDNIHQEAAKQMFLRLVTLGEGAGDTRRRANRSELLTISPNSDVMEEVIDTFALHRMLSLDHDPATRTPTVEVAHEAILGQWKRLRNWINHNREEIKMQQQLSRMAEEWKQANLDPSYLATGTRLEQMVAWADNPGTALSAAERQFLDASIEERNRRKQTEQARKAREVALEQRSVQRLRGLVAVFVVATVVAVILASVAFVQRNAAEEARVTAVAAQDEALTQATIAQDNVNTANSLLLSNQAETIYHEQNMPLGLALILTANQFSDTPPIQSQAVLADLAYAPGPQRVFMGHENSVNEVDFSPDGRYAISASDDQTLILWDVATGENIRTFTGHTDRVVRVAFLPDGQTVASSSLDNTSNLWDVETGEILHTFAGGSWGMVVSPDGQYLIATNRETEELMVWDIETRASTQIGIEQMPTYSADGQFAAFEADGGDEPSIVIWNIVTGESVKVIQTSTSSNALDFSPDGQYIVSGGATINSDHIVNVWNVTSGALVHEFAGHTEYIWDVAFSPDGQTVASASLDGTVRLWDVNSGNLITVSRGHGDEVNSIDFSPDGQHLISASGDNSILLWDLQDHNLRYSIDGFTRPVEDIAYHPDGQKLAAASFRDITLWDVETGESIATLSGHTDTVNAVAFTPDGQSIVSTSNDKKLHLWDWANQTIIRTFEGHKRRVLSMDLSDDGQLLASGSTDKSVILWDVNTGEALQIFEGHKRDVFSVDISPDGQLLASGSFREVIVWDVASGEALLTLEGHNSDVNAVVFSPDGSMIASGSKDKTVIIWDATSGEVLSVLADFDGAVNTIAFNGDGSNLVIGLGDGTVSVIDLSSNTELRRFTEHSGDVFAVAFSPDEQSVVSASADHTVKIWRMDNLEQLVQWTIANRYIAELDCERQLQFRIETLCEDVSADG